MNLVQKIRDTWWTNIKDHYCDILKKKSGDAGSSKGSQSISWTFYDEMSFMKKFIYSRK